MSHPSHLPLDFQFQTDPISAIGSDSVLSAFSNLLIPSTEVGIAHESHVCRDVKDIADSAVGDAARERKFPC